MNEADDILRTVPSKGKRRLFRLAAVFCGLFFGLAVAEMALRIAGYSSPEFYMADDVCGYALIPNMSGRYRKEGKSFVEINSDGFRDSGHEIAKKEGVKRIAIIGDSYVEALQVERSESFVNFVQDELRRCDAFDGSQIEILSFGVSGYGTAQELLMMRDKVLKYSPDIVMLVMTTNNDITDNARVFKKTAIPYFEFHDGALTLDESFRKEKPFVVKRSALGRLGVWFRNNLRVVQAVSEIQVALKYKYQRWKEQPAASGTQIESRPEPVNTVTEVGIDYQVYRSPVDVNWENSWRVTEGILDLMNNEVRASGARFVVVTASNGVQVLPNVETRHVFAKMLGVDDLFYPDRRIADFCRMRSIHVITLAPALADYAARERVNIHGFEGNIGYGHWNQLGHRIAGAEIGRQLCLSGAQ